MSEKALNIVLRFVHHAGYPHPLNHLRVQISRDWFDEQKENLVFGLIYIEGKLCTYSLLLNLKKRKFITNSSINFKLESLSEFSLDRSTFTEYGELLYVGSILEVFILWERYFNLSLINVIDSRLILSAIVFHPKFSFRVIDNKGIYGLGSRYYMLKECEYEKIGIVKNEHSVIIQFYANGLVKLEKSAFDFFELSRELSIDVGLLVDEIGDPCYSKINYDFIKGEFCVTDSDYCFEISSDLFNKFRNGEISIDEIDDCDLIVLKEMESKGFATTQGLTILMHQRDEVIYNVLKLFWEFRSHTLFLKDECLNWLSENYHINENQSLAIFSFGGLIRRRLCISGKPFLYYHIESQIDDISRDYSTGIEYMRDKLLEYFGRVDSLYLDFCKMITPADPNYIYNKINNLISNREGYWFFDRFLLNEIHIEISDEEKFILDDIYGSLAIGILRNADFCKSYYFNSELCYLFEQNLNTLNSLDFFDIDHDGKFLSINFSIEILEKLDSWRDEHLFLPVVLANYFRKSKERRDLSFQFREFTVNYITRYNKINYIRHGI